MSEYKELYLPFYFTWREMTAELSDAELGQMLRALLDNFSERRVPPELPEKNRIIYRFMLDGAVRTHKGQRELSEKRRESANKRWSTRSSAECADNANECNPMQSDAVKVNGNVNENENVNVNVNGNGNGNRRFAKATKKERYGDFDAEEAFAKALLRSYSESEANTEEESKAQQSPKQP